ncbi:MAG TPA: ADP-forming succinate--CoA ligase subunit beta [Polyangiales bacterium]|nr:ADP-forming succinate--CoA ligase subunit beta [Polyangiales bacterium]
MNIHEYQGKDIFRKYGIPVPKGVALMEPSGAKAAAQKLIDETKIPVVVVKAQIHAGGRGKAGGVKVVKGGPDAAQAAANEIFGKTLVTHQTGPEGKKVQRLLVEQGLDIARELYLAVVLDREKRRVTFMASTEGGMDVEEVAAKTPEKIIKVTVDPAVGLAPFQARQIAFALGVTGDAAKELAKVVTALEKVFMEEDCSLVEINPLVVTKDNHIVALDAKFNLEDNAAFRHKEWDQWRDMSEENQVEIDAKAAGLSYIQLDGNIGCLVNGAGLAMATMDIIQHYGGSPANFLDVGGGATKEAVTTAFKIILTSPSVKGIFVNIFGGIAQCDTIAAGVIAATKELGLSVPLAVRLEGTNVELGRKMLAESGLKITPATTMGEGAQKIVELVKKGA